MWSRAFWKALAERAIATGAEAALLAWGGGTLPNVSLPWWTVPAAFAGGCALGALKGLVVNHATGNGPGLTEAEQVVDVD